MIRKGSCQCGQVKYEVEGPDIGLVICYCTECQKMSTGIATYSMVIPRASFRVESGSLRHWERQADSGARNICHFCPECGIRIFHENPEIDHIRLKAGTLDNASQLEPDVHVWTRSAPAWVELPNDCLSYERQPETRSEMSEMIAAIQARRTARGSASERKG